MLIKMGVESPFLNGQDRILIDRQIAVIKSYIDVNNKLIASYYTTIRNAQYIGDWDRYRLFSTEIRYLRNQNASYVEQIKALIRKKASPFLSGFSYKDFTFLPEDEMLYNVELLGYIPLYYTSDNTITSATQEYNKMLEHEKWLSAEIARHLKLALTYVASLLMAWAAPQQRKIAADLGKEREVLRTFLPKVQALTVETAQEARETQQTQQLQDTLNLEDLASRAGYNLVPVVPEGEEKPITPGVAFAIPAVAISALSLIPMK